jgi:hypothetical protein
MRHADAERRARGRWARPGMAGEYGSVVGLAVASIAVVALIILVIMQRLGPRTDRRDADDDRE